MGGGGRVTAAELAERTKAKRRGDRWFTHCPVHAENTPSLSIREGRDGRILLRCFGCHADIEDLADGLGLEMADLFPDGHRKGRSREFRTRREQLRETDPLTLERVERIARDIRRLDRAQDRLIANTRFVLAVEAHRQGWGAEPERITARRQAELEEARGSTREDGLDHLTPQQCDELCEWVLEMHRESD